MRSAGLRCGVLQRDQKLGARQDHKRGHRSGANAIARTLGTTLALFGVTRRRNNCRSHAATLPRHLAPAATGSRLRTARDRPTNDSANERSKLFIAASVIGVTARAACGSRYTKKTVAQGFHAHGFAQEYKANRGGERARRIGCNRYRA